MTLPSTAGLNRSSSSSSPCRPHCRTARAVSETSCPNFLFFSRPSARPGSATRPPPPLPPFSFLPPSPSPHSTFLLLSVSSLCHLQSALERVVLAKHQNSSPSRRTRCLVRWIPWQLCQKTVDSRPRTLFDSSCAPVLNLLIPCLSFAPCFSPYLRSAREY